MTKTLNQFKALVLCGVVILMTQWVNLIKGGVSFEAGKACIGMLCIIFICVLALKIKELIPWKIPAFAWASLLALLLTTPWSPVDGILLDMHTPGGMVAGAYDRTDIIRTNRYSDFGCGRYLYWNQIE